MIFFTINLYSASMLRISDEGKTKTKELIKKEEKRKRKVIKEGKNTENSLTYLQTQFNLL